jgi:hypothetical protein
MNLKKFFCSHDDEIIHEFEMKSRFEIIAENVRLTAKQPNMYDSPRRLHVIYFKCNKCKRIRKDKSKTI